MGVQVWGIIRVTFLYKLSCRITNAEIIATLISYDFLSLIHTIYCAFYDLTQSDTNDVELWTDEDVDDSDRVVTSPDHDDGSPTSGSVLSNLRPKISDKITEKDQRAESHKSLLRLYLFIRFMFQTLFRLSDTALDVLLKFMVMFFKSLQHQFTAFPKTFTDILPNSIKSARNTLGNSRDRFDRYVCCPGCNSLYRMSECVLKSQMAP